MPNIAAPAIPQSIDDSVCELASLFATGILRLRARPGLAAELSSKLSESTGRGLEFPATTRLSVPNG